MLPINNILHATDFSPHANCALRLACALARDYEAGLILLHVRPTQAIAFGEFGAVPPETPEPSEFVREKLRHLLPAHFTGRVECFVRDGEPAEEIIAAAQQSHCDLVVLGTHGRTGLGRFLLGSVAEAVLRKCPCPVLTVKQPLAEAVAAPAPATEESDLVTIYSVANPVEAEVIKNALKSEGIRCAKFIRTHEPQGV